MRIKDYMSTEVETTSPDTSLREVAKRMAEGNFGVMPVCEGSDIKGMITDRDICIRAVAEGEDPDEVKVRDVMTEEVLCCYEDQSTDEVAHMMQDRQVRRVPVLDRNESLVGILSLGDLAVLSNDKREVAETLDEISQPLQH